MSRYRYSEWAGSQDIVDPDAGELMDELGRELMSSRDLSDALRLVQRAGVRDSRGRGLPGIDELLKRLRQSRESQLEKYKLGSAMDEVHQNSDNILKTGPSGIQKRLEEIRQQAREGIGKLSPEVRQKLLKTIEDMAPQNLEKLDELLEILQKMDKLEAQLSDCQYNRSLDAVDEQLLTELMGDETADELRRLHNIPRTLDEAGYIRCKEGKYELTPRGMRKVGQKALADVFAQLRKDDAGGHNINLWGIGGERISETKRFEAGDDFQINLQKTIMNSLYREPRTPPIRLNAEDFEVFKTEGLTRSTTVLMLDLSFSMPARGHFEAAKRVAIAIDGLIRSQYPKDRLYIVGFSSYARQIKKEDLAYMGWDEFDPYTNIQHGLYIARKLLAKEKCVNKQIILVSDGEPTAHTEGENTFFHQVPPSLRTLQLTLREARKCTQKGIVINTFMLENDRFLSDFVTEMARINKGRVFFTSADSLGQYLIVDYISNKRRRI